ELQAGLAGDGLEDLRRGAPLLVGADELVLLPTVLVAGGELEVEVVEAEVPQQGEDEVEEVTDLVRRTLLRHVRVGVGLREAAHAREAVDGAGGLVAVDGAELEESQRQLAVGAAAGAVDEV